ncbi:HAD superfamily hydrolase (TIGR01509 family) [Neolewinella xylanilytica]|uniref:HAD superfamily hydrolase (TIGR01509 family) n=1 Tax=Neolewinella xylanilytica TaxID=1514080 RepID=A0A2S6I272_9BACT|nr:HAD family phosphatase [Neolewinella xylanilytica]PPK85274.1 HAD superfamily hydrolase (TIGR01509 family) [Neolewinella xylanilytica]
MTPISFKGILFDLDGTLVDNMMVHHRAWQRKLQELGLEYSLDRVKAEIHGVNTEILERLFGDEYTHEERLAISRDKEAAYREIFAPEIVANTVGGALDFIKQAYAEDVPMAIGTAGPEENAFFVIDALDIRSMMGHVVHSGMVNNGKPDPEVFRKAAEGIGVDVKDCLIFEDSVTGARAANNAGCPVVVLTTTHSREEFEGLEVAAFREDFRGLTVERQPTGGFLLAQ